MTTSKNDLFSNRKQLSRKVRFVAPYEITHTFRAGTDFTGKSLLEMISARFPFRDEHEWELRIKSGKVGVNGKEVNPDYILTAEDEIFHYNPRVVEPTVPDEVEVLKETGEYLIVFKPAPMAMHSGGRYHKNSLVEILKEQGYRDLRIIHRLDGVTSGIVLFAKTKDFARKAMECFSNGRVRKTYFALVDGIPEQEEITIDAPIRRKTGFVFESAVGLEKAKNAVTRFEVVERYEGSSLIKCNPVTGRTHQIRLHLDKWGYPIIDDPIYGKHGDQSSKSSQNTGISLVSAGLEIEELGVNYSIHS